MSGHVVRAFDGMRVGERFRREPVNRRFEVGQNVGVGVFVDRQRRRRVLQKEMQQPCLDVCNFGHCVEDFPRYKRKTPPWRRFENKGTLVPNSHD